MGQGSRGERFQIISAFQYRDEPAATGTVGEGADLAGDPAVVGVLQFQLAERVAPVGVETGRDDDQLGVKLLNCWQAVRPPGVPEFRAAITRGQRQIEYVAAALFFGKARARVKRVLVAGNIQHVRRRFEDSLRAVTVVDIEIQDRHALRTVRCLGMAGGDGGVVQQAKAHGPGRLGVVPRWPGDAERVLRPSPE